MTRHYIIGIAILVTVFWGISEIPSIFYFQQHLTEWIATFVSIPLNALLFSKLVNKRLKEIETRLYLYSCLIILATWILTLYFKAVTVGVVASIESGQPKLIEAIAGFTFYQLWIYLALGIIHGAIGGIFLKIDFKKYLDKVENGTQQYI